MEYWYSEEVKEIADRIVASRLPELADAKLAYVMKEKCSKQNKNKVLGKTSKASPMQNFFLDGCHYILEFGADGWGELTAHQREAAIYHYLCYCDVDVDDETNEYVYKIKHPDIQEFSEVIATYGFWHEDLKKFGRNVKAIDFDDETDEPTIIKADEKPKLVKENA